MEENLKIFRNKVVAANSSGIDCVLMEGNIKYNNIWRFAELGVI